MSRDLSLNAPARPQVMRNVELRPHPHTLSRPGGRGALEQDLSAPLVETAAPERDVQAELAQAFQRGHEEGCAAGRAEERAAAQADAVKSGYEQGLNEGMAAGAERARKDAAAAVQARLGRLDAILGGLQGQFKALLAQSEDDLVALAFEVVVHVLGEQAASTDGLRALVRHHVEQFGDVRVVEARVHPDDVAALTENLELGAWATGKLHQGLRVVGDASVEMGGVVLRSEQGSLEARLDRQIDVLKQRLIAVRLARKGEN